MENIYFKTRNGEFYTKFTKEEIYSTINPYDWNTMLIWLEEMDYPPFSFEYFRKLQQTEERGENPKFAFGKFLATMRLAVFRSFKFSDGDFMIAAWDKTRPIWGI